LVKPIESAHGEIVSELIGNAAGGSQMYSLAQIVLPPGKASRKHYHPVAEESYHILSGLARLEMDGETAALGPGDSAAIPPKKVHQIFNDGDETLIFLAICVPAWTPDNSIYLD
jgi:mannose-6-phosphate isomerase-like protein (cupin superfamily)